MVEAFPLRRRYSQTVSWNGVPVAMTGTCSG